MFIVLLIKKLTCPTIQTYNRGGFGTDHFRIQFRCEITSGRNIFCQLLRAFVLRNTNLN